MTARELPRYIDRGGEIVYRQPYVANGVRQYLFFLRGERKRLGEMFERYLKEPSGGAVDLRPLTEVVAVSLLHIDAIRSAEPPDSEVGAGIEEWELAFWTLGVDLHRLRLVFFTPYMFVDSGMAMAAGREVFGFPKQHGWFDVRGDGAPEAAALDVLSAERFDPSVPFRRHRLIELSRVEPKDDLTHRWGTYTEATRGLAAAVAEGHGQTDMAAHAEDVGLLRYLGDAAERWVVDHVFEFIAAAAGTMQVPILFLKQIRDIAQPDRACYQAVTEGWIRVTGFHGAGLLGGYRVTVSDLASQPVLRDLGLASGPTTPLAGGWIHYDFLLEKGAEVWRAL